MKPDIEQQICVRREMVDQVKRLLIDVLQLDLADDEIAEDGPLFGFGLGLDSIDALTLMIAVEDRFSIAVNNEDLPEFRSVNAIADFVVTHSRQAVV